MGSLLNVKFKNNSLSKSRDKRPQRPICVKNRSYPIISAGQILKKSQFFWRVLLIFLILHSDVKYRYVADWSNPNEVEVV